MKRILSLAVLTFCACAMVMGAVKKTKLKVLYVGGHSNYEVFGNKGIDADEIARSVAERTAAWKEYLEQYFTNVKTVSGSDYAYQMSYDYDVTIIDGDPKPLEPRRSIIQNGVYDKIVYAKYFPENFDQPVITIAEESELVGHRNGVKNDWYCLCLAGNAFNINRDNAIFKGPYPVKLTFTNRPTPAGAKEYAEIYHENLPATTPMWKVQTEDYLVNPKFKVGMVTRPWGYLDSPETDIISGGESAKCYDAIAIGRHANWLHWGFSASPAHMTDEAKPVFANAVVYISKFKGQHIIARKLNDGIATRATVDEAKLGLDKENYDAYVKSIEASNAQVKILADSLKQVVAAGGQLDEMEEAYMQMAENPQEPADYETYLRERAGDLYERFGTDVDAYVKYYTENRPYFYGSLFNDYGVTLDEDAKALGIANNDKRILDQAIALWESGRDPEMGKRILYRYTLLRYDNAKQWREWYDKYQSKLFFTESGGWLWLVNSQKANTPGNDYSVLKYNEVDESALAPMKETVSKEDPVKFSTAVTRTGTEGELIIRIKIYPGYHIYSVVPDPDPYIQTTYEITTDGDITLKGDLEKPAGKLMEGSHSVIFEGEQVLRQKFTGREGSIKVIVNYQACDNHACMMPKTEVLEIEI